jgi:hypothetical protein
MTAGDDQQVRVAPVGGRGRRSANGLPLKRQRLCGFQPRTHRHLINLVYWARAPAGGIGAGTWLCGKSNRFRITPP